MVFHIELQSMKLTKLKGKAHQANPLMDAGFNASQCRDLDLEDKPRSERPTRFESFDEAEEARLRAL
ncbi:hypothetical protein KIN20_027209 [Parelaphostrongylus tenuis]|uniref:Uncharacterized protein n=1 Tax=Parelaphostrongylus tenuis TaxID=148309 RepID=A0AAD5WDJ4_PARTN|nr:hypothetical protein KIN20_027209 [Parelaphostrongylus tenuis]